MSTPLGLYVECFYVEDDYVEPPGNPCSANANPNIRIRPIRDVSVQMQHITAATRVGVIGGYVGRGAVAFTDMVVVGVFAGCIRPEVGTSTSVTLHSDIVVTRTRSIGCCCGVGHELEPVVCVLRQLNPMANGPARIELKPVRVYSINTNISGRGILNPTDEEILIMYRQLRRGYAQ